MLSKLIMKTENRLSFCQSLKPDKLAVTVCFLINAIRQYEGEGGWEHEILSYLKTNPIPALILKVTGTWLDIMTDCKQSCMTSTN